MSLRHWHGAQWWIAIGFAILLALAPLGSAVRANGVPTVIELAYIEGLSTWGPEDATGQAEISFSGGTAHVSATGLPMLDDQRMYQGWLVNSESNAAVTIGRFNADENGEVNFDGALPAIDEFGFDLFLITVEPDPDEGLQPTSDRTIGGYFSLVGPSATESTAGGDTADSSEQQQQPAQLPATGDPTLVTDLTRVALLGAAAIASLFFGLRFARSGSARREQ